MARARPAQAPESDYYAWRERIEVVGRDDIAVATKPGTTGFDRRDEADALLAEAIGQDEADDVLDLNCRQGLVGVVAARGRRRRSMVLASGNLVDVDAARRTLAANGVANVLVWHSFGTDHLPSTAPVDAVAVRIPKGRFPLLRCLRQAHGVLRVGGRLYLAGANDDGIKSALDWAARLWGTADVLAYRGGARVGVATKLDDRPLTDPDLADPLLAPGAFHQFTTELRGRTLAVKTRPGVFAWDRLDAGTRLLAESLSFAPGERVLDLGCGSGILGLLAARECGPGGVTLVDVDVDAIDASRATLAANALPPVDVLASDAASAVMDRRFDLVVTNPPFHVGRETEYGVARQFARDAAAVLSRSGRLAIVANRFLPYEATLRESFASVESRAEDERFKVLIGRKPRASS